MKRMIAHVLLMSSVLSISLAFAGYYGNIVNEGSYEYITRNWWQLPSNYTLTGNIETMSFGQDNIPNDTITITITNLGDHYLWIRTIYINEESHNVNTINSIIFDANGYFYYTRIVPPGGFGVIRLDTSSEDLTPTDGVYDVKVITNAGILEKSFTIESSTFRNPTLLSSFSPYIVVILFSFYVGIHYYRKFQIVN